jgi:hypothetical protein
MQFKKEENTRTKERAINGKDVALSLWNQSSSK